MRFSSFKWLVLLLLVNGVLLEIDYSYKQAMSIPTYVMPSNREFGLPRVFQNSPLAESGIVHHLDTMTLTSGSISWTD